MEIDNYSYATAFLKDLHHLLGGNMQKSNGLETDGLRKSLEILRLLHYRNKNQHRRSRWWEVLCAVKGCTQKLLNEVEDDAFSVLGIALLAETARIQALIDPIQDPMKLPEHASEAQGNPRTNQSRPSGPKEWEDVGRLVQRPASSTATPDLIAEDVSLNQATDHTTMRKIATAEDKQLRKPRKTIEELFRTLE
ncbi:MAG: hypothetical protein Q9172_003150 [Xanthocarpia lactea]